MKDYKTEKRLIEYNIFPVAVLLFLLLFITLSVFSFIYLINISRLKMWNQNDWSGGSGQQIFGDINKYGISQNLEAGRNIKLAQIPGTETFVDLGVPWVSSEVKIGENGNWGWVSALTEGKDGKIYGSSTTVIQAIGGSDAHFFTYDPIINKITDKGAPIKGGLVIYDLVTGIDGRIYGGTSAYDMSHFFIYEPKTERFIDKGEIIEGESRIYSLACGNDGKIYGGTFPNAHLFIYDPAIDKVFDKGQVVKRENTIFRLIPGKDKKIYGGTIEKSDDLKKGGHLIIYDPEIDKIIDRGQVIRSENRVYGLTTGLDGRIYGGTLPHAHFFAYDPSSGNLKDYGSLSPEEEGKQGIVGMTTGSDGRIFMSPTSKTWEKDFFSGPSQSSARIFAYDSDADNLQEIGIPIEKELDVWVMITSREGKIYGGTLGAGHFFSYSGKYQKKGELISSSFDSKDLTREIRWSKISWMPEDQNIKCGKDCVKFQIATNNDNKTWEFLGPDGTRNSYYRVAKGEKINPKHNGQRYIKYKLYLTTEDENFSPYLENITINYWK